MVKEKKNISLSNGTLTLFINKYKSVNKKKVPYEKKIVINYTDIVCVGDTEEDIKRFFKPQRVYKDYKGERFYLTNIEITIKKVGTKTNYKL